MQYDTLIEKILCSHDFAEIRNSGILPDPDGDDGYYFISYSHRDYKRVLPDVVSFQTDGLRVWYDRGLESGKSWLNEVKKKISSYYCKGVLVYLSRNYAASASCMSELAHIAAQNKPCVFVLLDDAAETLDEQYARFVRQNVCLPADSDKAQREQAATSLPAPKLFEYCIRSATRLNAFRKIGAYAFVKKLLDKNLLRVQIPPFAYIDGKKYRVRGVAHFAFENCELLEEVSIPDGWIAVTESAFVRCPSLKKVELGSPVDTLRVHAGVVQHAFVGCENLRELTCTDEKATVMLLGTFSHNEALRNAELPAGFCVDSACFASCTMLEKATLHKKDCLTRGYVFHNCVSLRHVEIPTDNISVSIGDYTFFNCKKLERIRIPARTKNICRSAFEKCASLGEITLPKSIEYIDPTAFADCTALKEVTVEGNVNDMLSAPIGTLYLDEIFRHATKFYAARPLPPQAFRGKFVAAPSDKRGYDLYIKEEPHGIL